MRRSIVLLAIAAVSLVACSGSSSTPKSATTTKPRTSTTTVTPGSSTTATTATTAGCPGGGGTADVRNGFPDRMSPLVGKDVRTGGHRCFDRFVIELQPSDPGLPFPGYWVRYVPKPITTSPSDLPVTIRGSAVLMVSLGSWMNGPEQNGYAGPKDVVPKNVSTILEYLLNEDFEGQSAWALGLDRTRPFTVTTLTAPPRLVVDIATG